MPDIDVSDEKIIINGRVFKKLLERPEWPVYCEALQAMILFKTQQLTRPAGSLDGAFVLEFEKGVIEGLRLCLTMPEATIETMKELQAIKNQGDE